MKATLDIVDPLHREIKARARTEEKTFKAKVEELLRLGLENDSKEKKKPFKINFPKGAGPLLVDLLDKETMSKIEDEKFYRVFAKK
jgi:hypothetical protein